MTYQNYRYNFIHGLIMRLFFKTENILKINFTKHKFLKRDEMDKISQKRFHRQIQNGQTIEHSLLFLTQTNVTP